MEKKKKTKKKYESSGSYQWPTPGLGTDRRNRSTVERCRDRSFPAKTAAWPFLLGVELGILPFGRALKVLVLVTWGMWLFSSSRTVKISCFLISNIFLEETGEGKAETMMAKTMKSQMVGIRRTAMKSFDLWGENNILGWERKREMNSIKFLRLKVALKHWSVIVYIVNR